MSDSKVITWNPVFVVAAADDAAAAGVVRLPVAEVVM